MLHDGKVSTEHFRPDASSKFHVFKNNQWLIFYSGRMVYGIGLNIFFY